MKRCIKCGETKDITDFHVRNSSPDGRAPRCKACRSTDTQSEYVRYGRDRYNDRGKKREQLIEERGGQCQICGYGATHWALHFHHLDPSTKKFKISGNPLRLPIGKLRDEAAKTVLVCANCHAELHAGLHGPAI